MGFCRTKLMSLKSSLIAFLSEASLIAFHLLADISGENKKKRKEKNRGDLTLFLTRQK